jgi:hypothetical protein
MFGCRKWDQLRRYILGTYRVQASSRCPHRHWPNPGNVLSAILASIDPRRRCNGSLASAPLPVWLTYPWPTSHDYGKRGLPYIRVIKRTLVRDSWRHDVISDTGLNEMEWWSWMMNMLMFKLIFSGFRGYLSVVAFVSNSQMSGSRLVDDTRKSSKSE